MLKYFFLISVLINCGHVLAQDSVVLPPPDTTSVVPPVKKPVIRKPVKKKDTTAVRDTFQQTRLIFQSSHASFDSVLNASHPYFKFVNPTRHSVSVRKWTGKESIFYTIIALLLFFATIRNGFRRYIQDLFKIFFGTTVNHRQVKEQLLQSPLPSLLLNIFYLLSLGMFLSLMLHHFGYATEYNFWMLFMYSMIGLVLIYTVKFISLKLVGWVFEVSEVVDAYIFIVFTTNKIIGMALVPFLVVLALTYGFLNQAAMNLGIFIILILFAYRYFLSYVSVHRLVRINFFHFILYLMAFEIVPLLLINKVLFRLLGETP